MSRSTTLVVSAVVIAALTGHAAPAAAQDAAQAEALFKQGKQMMADGRLGEACEAFAASQRLDASTATLMNLADCREKNDQFASAWEAFVAVERQTRGDGRYGKMNEIARDRAAALEPRLSYLTINVADEVRVEGLQVMRDGAVIEPGAWNRALPIDGGEHVVSGRAPGHETWSTKITVEPEHDKAQVEVPKFKALRNPGGKTVIIEHTRPSAFTPRRKIAVGVAAGGVAAVIAGALLGVRARSIQDDADRTCGTSCTLEQAAEANRLNGQARDSALYANLAFGVGAAAVGTAAVLWLTGKPRPGPAERPDQPGGPPQGPAQVSITPRLTPGYLGLSAAVRF